MVAVDGTWHRKCTLLDISSTGARLMVEESFDGLNLKEFFLQLIDDGPCVPPLRTDPCQRQRDRRRLCGGAGRPEQEEDSAC